MFTETKISVLSKPNQTACMKDQDCKHALQIIFTLLHALMFFHFMYNLGCMLNGFLNYCYTGLDNPNYGVNN